MNLFLQLLLCISVSRSQLISMNVCSDNNCNTNCISWIATNGQCSPCKNDQPCSNTNPSSITTLSTFTLYTDSKCLVQIPNTYSSPINLDNSCNLLYTNGNQSLSGSYKGYNLSMLIGVVIGSIILLILLLTCVLCCCGVTCCCNNKPPPNNAIVIIDEKQIIPEYGYKVQIQPSAYPVQPINNYYSTYPSAPPANNYYPSYPSAPPANNYYPSYPSAPPATNII